MRRVGNWVWRLRGSGLLRYGVACLFATLAVALQRWIELLTGHVSYEVLLIAVALSALYGGITNGMLALVITGAGTLYFYLPERSGAGAGIPTAVLRLLLFLLLGAALSWLVGRLRTAHGQLTAALAGIGEAVAITGAEGRVVFLNPIAEALSGWKLKEAKGRPFQEIVHLVNEETGGQIEDPIGKVMQTGAKLPVDNHAVLRSRDGTGTPIEDSVAPVRDAAGKVNGVIVTFRDVSSRRALEDRLRHAQNVEALRTLAGGVAHEFDNFLTAIAGHAELLSSRVAAIGPLVREDVNEILKASERAVQLSRQLLLFSRRQVVHANPLSLNDLLSGMERTLQSRLGGRIELAMRLDPHLGRVKINAGQLEQVILNLAINAREAMPTGGRLTIRTANVHLDPSSSGELAALRPGQYVELEVTDNGNGMEEEVRARVFEPFFTTKPDGAGLGLSIADGIVRQWGGAIWVSSRPGHGSTFWTYLPHSEETQSEPLGPRPTGRRNSAASTILVAERDAAVRSLVGSILRDEGFHVLEASDDLIAARIAADEINTIDLIVADAGMPLMGHPKLIQRLTLLRPDLKVLVIGNSGPPLPRLPENVAVLSKPFEASAFLSEIERLLGARF